MACYTVRCLSVLVIAQLAKEQRNMILAMSSARMIGINAARWNLKDTVSKK
jgi:hypothetical protein